MTGIQQGLWRSTRSGAAHIAMEHLRDDGKLDATRTVEVKTQELKQLATEYKHLSSIYNDIESKPPKDVPFDGDIEEFKATTLFDAQTTSLTLDWIQTKERKLLTYVSSDLYGKMKDVFTRYASPKAATRVELLQFHRFLRDSTLSPTMLSRSQADLLFFQGNQGKSITFWRWIEVLAQIAKKHYQSKKGLESLSRLISAVVLQAPGIRSNDLPIGQWNSDIARLGETLIACRGQLGEIYRIFRSRRADAAGKMSLSNYLVCCTDMHIVPELLSKIAATRLFRAAQSDSFTDLASYEEFEQTCCYLAFATHTGKSCSDSVNQFVQWLRYSAQALRIVELEAGRSIRLD